MIELPEALTLSRQINETVAGKRVTKATAAHSPHKFAWYSGDPGLYDALLTGKTIDTAEGAGGMVEIRAGGAVILLSDGVGLRYHGPDEAPPDKHQLLIEFEDGSSISASVQMYGGLCCFAEGNYDNKYYKIAKEKPSPLSDGFNREYFDRMMSAEDAQKLSAKAFLATEQRIPGLGNGILQDILYNAGIHAKRKIATLTDAEKEELFSSIKSIIADITHCGGRDTERDLFGHAGGYSTKLSKNTVGKPCHKCGSLIRKENYMGGSIYYCGGCQIGR